MRYISMLRGINVSGQKVIKMTDLKALFERLGYKNALTYIQSGNVLFSTAEKRVKAITRNIETAIEMRFGFHVPVFLRTAVDMGRLCSQSPFGHIDVAKDGTKYLVTFLSGKVDEQKVEKIRGYAARNEKIIAAGKEVHLYCPDGYGKSKLSNTFIEKVLSLTATTRNMKTVCKLHEMALADELSQ